MPACQPWQLCVGTRCETGVLTLRRPVVGATFDAGDAVGVEAELTYGDGGPWPVAVGIPVTTTWGATTTVSSGVAGPVAGAAAAGVGRVTAGWDGGLEASRDVSFVSCVASCAGYQQCVSTSSGGQCVAMPLTVSITSPGNDGLYTNALGLVMQVTVMSADGGMPTAVPVVGPGVSVMAMRDMPDAGTYSASVGWMGPEGPKVFVAGWDAGVRFQAQRVVTYDATGPMVTVAVLPAPMRAAHEVDPQAAGAWKKDEAALVAVTVTDATSPVSAVTAGMVVGPGDAGVTEAPGACGSCMPATGMAQTGCYCFRAPLDATPVPGARATTVVEVRGAQDVPQNSANGTSPPFTVTRLRWARDISLLATTSAIQPVAVGRAGLVVTAVQDRAGAAGRVVATNPDGTGAWEAVTSGTVTAGPVVGATEVWVGRNDGSDTYLQPLSLMTGALATRTCVLTSPTAFSGDLALATVAGPVEVPLGLRAGEVQGPAMGNCRIHALTPAPTDDTAKASLVVQVDGGAVEAFVAYESDTRLWKARLSGTAWAAQGDVGLPMGTQPKGLFLGAGFVGGGGGGVTGNGAFFQTTSAGPLSQTTSTVYAVGAANAGPASRGATGLYYGTTGGAVGAVAADVLGPLTDGGVVATTGLGNLQGTVPVLGKGGLVYVVGASGALSVRRQVDLSEVYQGSLASLSGAGNVAQPALDVYRTGAGVKDCGRPLGVLYVLTRSGATATLRAVLVESNGLEATAPWPKYQRDNGNTGNINSDMSFWTCP